MDRWIASTCPIVFYTVLAVCVSVCCCRVGAVVDLLPGTGAAAADSVSICMIGESCCQRDDAESDEVPREQAPREEGCGGLCCIKGTTPDKTPKFAPALSFVGTLPVAEILAPAATPARRVDRVRVPPGSYCPSLLRQRCALLI